MISLRSVNYYFGAGYLGKFFNFFAFEPRMFFILSSRTEATATSFYSTDSVKKQSFKLVSWVGLIFKNFSSKGYNEKHAWLVHSPWEENKGAVACHRVFSLLEIDQQQLHKKGREVARFRVMGVLQTANSINFAQFSLATALHTNGYHFIVTRKGVDKLRSFPSVFAEFVFCLLESFPLVNGVSLLLYYYTAYLIRNNLAIILL